MLKSFGYAAMNQEEDLIPFDFKRREPGPRDLAIDIHFCGVCHTDLNAIRNAFGFYSYPLVPGHEIVGTVSKVGNEVTKFKEGDWVGVGTIIDSCRECIFCKDAIEPHCIEGATQTYGFPDRQGQMVFGGFSKNYVVSEDFALKIPEGLDPASAAPLLCAGITTYSPLRRAGIGSGNRVGVIGLGGLGHIAVKWAKAFGAHVTVFTTSPDKAEQVQQLGADEAILSSNDEVMAQHADAFDYILDTVSGDHDVNKYLQTLKHGGVLCMVGMPVNAPTVSPMLLAMGRRVVTGSMIGGITETQEMLEFAANKGITCDIEIVGIQEIQHAFTRLEDGDVRYRFVVDMNSLKEAEKGRG